MRGRLALLLLLGVCVTPAAADVDRTWFDPYFGKEWVLTADTDQVLVLYESTVTAEQRAAVALAAGLDEVRPYHAELHTALYRVSSGSAESAATALALRPEVAGASPAVHDGEGFPKYFIPGQLTLQFDPQLGDAECRRRIADTGARVLEDYWTPGYYRVGLAPGQELFATLRTWNARPEIRFVEPVYMCYDDALAVPNDPLYPNQWGMDNPGTGAWHDDADVRATEVWDITRGDPGVLIVIVDTGLDLVHEDLATQVIPRNGDDWDFSSTSSDVPNDTGDHGTACAGIAVAIQNNAKGVSGICPECSLMPLKIDLSSGANANRADAINYAASRRVDFSGLVISCSWRMSSGDFTAVQAAVQNAWAAGCVLCFSSGNGNTPVVEYPARYPECIAVGATSPCDERKNPSSCDGESFWGSSYGAEQEVMAPGVLITTTDRSGSAGYDPGNYTSTFNGTSSACPLAAGVAGLIWSANPSLTNQEVRLALRQNADDQVGPPNEDAPGWDQFFGYGRVNALRAVEAVSVVDSFDDDLESGAGGFTTRAVTEN
ncbi:MAG: S8 family serine peptidase, partial [Candidatus Eisenbacteria bacterium]|nr:S8 family serine peptidase [Candidatus Eisenbacteria bacterium]